MKKDCVPGVKQNIAIKTFPDNKRLNLFYDKFQSFLIGFECKFLKKQSVNRDGFEGFDLMNGDKDIKMRRLEQKFPYCFSLYKNSDFRKRISEHFSTNGLVLYSIFVKKYRSFVKKYWDFVARNSDIFQREWNFVILYSKIVLRGWKITAKPWKIVSKFQGLIFGRC